MRFALLALLVVLPAARVAAAPVLLDGFETAGAWEPRPDGGQPPQIAVETARVVEGKAALRLAYRNGRSGWGNAQRALKLPAPDGTLEFRLYKERSSLSAAMHVWLEEPDGDLWVSSVTEAGAILGRWAPGWHRVSLPLQAFRFDGRGNKRQEREKVERILLGCNFGDFDVVVDALTFLPAGAPVAVASPQAAWRERIALGESRPEVLQLLGEGWYDGEGAELGRWTGRGGVPAQLKLALDAGRDALVTIRGNVSPERWATKRPVQVTLDGAPVPDARVDEAGGAISLRIPAAPAARKVVLGLSSGSFVPAQSGEGADTRTLGMKLMTLEIVSFPRGDSATPVARGEKGSIALLRDTLPRAGTPSDPEHLAKVLRASGYGVTFVRAEDLLNPLYLTRANFDVLVLPYGASYPADGKETLVQYLRGGGAFFSTGGYAFNNPVVLHRGRWVDRDTYLTAFETGYVDVGAPGDDAFLFGDWHGRESGHWEWGGHEGQTTKRWTGARAGVRMALDPAKAYTLRISMAYRGAEWYEQQAKERKPVRGRVLLDGKPLGQFSGEAGTIVLEYPLPAGRKATGKPAEITFETEPWSPGAISGSSDTRRVGIAVNWVKAVPEGVSEADLVPPSAPFEVQINTARGKAQDALGLEPDQIGAFDPSYPLTDAVRAVAAPGQSLAPADLRLDGPFEGFAAAGMFGSNSAVFPAGHARWIPILDAKDADGRQRGALGALAMHYAGPFAGSAWGFFGVTNRDLFAPGSPAMERLFVATIDALVQRVYLHGLATEWACYRDGDAVKAAVTVVNNGSRPQAVRVRFAIDGVAAVREVDGGELAPGKSVRLEAQWPAFAFTKDLYRVTATLVRGGKPADTMETGFAAWDPKVVAAGPRLDLRDNYFRINGRPALLCGTNQTGMLFASTFEDPLVWDRDLAQMSDNGVNLMRVLHFSPFAQGSNPKGKWGSQDLRQRPERLVRQTDALVQLCQKHNVALFLSLHDWIGLGLSDDDLDAQKEWARFWAGRYRDVPGIFYDVQNEPSVDVPDSADVRREWNALLRRRYGTDEKLRAAWGDDKASLGSIPVVEPKEEWTSVRARDYSLFRTEVLNRWVRANVEGVRAGDPDALVTVGYLQSLEPADKMIGARLTDFSNMHAYMPVSSIPEQLKFVDRRFEGKSFSLGEFGAKCHPAWSPSSFVGCTEAQGADHFLGFGHYTLGLGASFLANWSWKDMIDCVFPWGIVHPGDGVPKDVLPAFRNMSFFFRLFQPRYEAPSLYLLAPDGLRVSGGERQANQAILTAIRWLIDLRVPFNVINEYDLERLPATARTLVWPVPTCPDDATYARVKAFVQAGGSLLVTGDLSYDDQRKRTRAARLEELCGVRLAPAAAGAEPDLRAAVAVQPAGAKALDAEAPALFGHTVGKGRSFYCPTPLEWGGPEGAALYRRFLAAAGVRPEPVDAPAAVHAFRVGTVEPGSTWAFFNTEERGGPVEAKVAGTSVTLAPGKPGLLRLDAAGGVVAAEAQGTVRAAGKPVVEVTGHAMVAALDELPLAQSRALLVLPIGAGEVRPPASSGWKDAIVQAGELRRGKWVALETKPAGKGIVVTVPPARRNDLFLVCEKADAAKWSTALERLAGWK